MNLKEVENAIEALGPCDDCDGRGSIGVAVDGRRISCEACGGHEDALGTGIASQDKSALIAAFQKALADARDEARAELVETLNAVEVLWRGVFPDGFKPGPRGLGGDSDKAWILTDFLVKYGRVVKDGERYAWKDGAK